METMGWEPMVHFNALLSSLRLMAFPLLRKDQIERVERFALSQSYEVVPAPSTVVARCLTILSEGQPQHVGMLRHRNSLVHFPNTSIEPNPE